MSRKHLMENGSSKSSQRYFESLPIPASGNDTGKQHATVVFPSAEDMQGFVLYMSDIKKSERKEGKMEGICMGTLATLVLSISFQYYTTLNKQTGKKLDSNKAVQTANESGELETQI